jgi:phosphatidylinositol glycan class S
MDKSKDPKEQFMLSRDAVGLANQAFFDPSMMGLLYFVSLFEDMGWHELTDKPDEHKFAVYTPLFAPVAVPIVLGLIKEILAWRRRRRARRAAEAGPATEEVTEIKADQAEFNVEKTNAKIAPVVLEPEVVISDPPARSLRPRKKAIE